MQVQSRLEMWRNAQKQALGIEKVTFLPDLPQDQINNLKRNIK